MIVAKNSLSSQGCPSLFVNALTSRVSRLSHLREAIALGCTGHACSCRWAAPWVRQNLVRHRASGSVFSRSRRAIGKAFPNVSWRHTGPLASWIKRRWRRLVVGYSSRCSVMAGSISTRIEPVFSAVHKVRRRRVKE